VATADRPQIRAEHFDDMVDWGLVQHARGQMRELCTDTDGGGSLQCVDGTLVNGKRLNLPHCEAKQVVIDFGKADGGCYVMYRRFPEGGLAFGGCGGLDPGVKDQAGANCGNSWGQELADAVALPTGYNVTDCDVRIAEPTLLVKTDFPHHIYHHFTSIFNVWLSLHIAQLPTDGSVRVAFLDKFNHRKTEDLPSDEFLGVFSEVRQW